MEDSREAFFKNCYMEVVNKGCIGLVSGILHKKIEKMFRKMGSLSLSGKIIEVGAGQGQHFQYVAGGFDQYLETDIRNTQSHSIPGGLRRFVIADCTDLKFSDDSFDRVIATCLLVHLTDPEKALKEWRRVTIDQGVVSIWVALEPSILLRVLQKLTTKRKYSKFGYKYESIHYREHISHYPRMRMLLQEVFRKDFVTKQRFPFRGLWWHLNLVEIWSIRVSKK